MKPIGALIALVLLIPLEPASAQTPGPVTLDLGMGLGAGVTTGTYRDNNAGFAVNALLTVRPIPLGDGRLIVSGEFAVQGAGPSEDNCIPHPEGGCVSRFPEFTSVSLLGGWETPGAGLRLSSGPGVARNYGDWRNYRLAWSARADLWTGTGGSPIGLTTSVRTMVIPSYDGALFASASFLLGLRIG